MIKATTSRYLDLLKKLNECSCNSMPAEQYLECSFSMGNQLMQDLEQIYAKEKFATLEEEIKFFKHVLPEIRGLVEYLAMAYFAEVCAATESEKEVFWKEEQRKARRYFTKYEHFYEYYKNWETALDEKYFTARENAPEGAKLFDMANENFYTPTMHISRIMARERYLQFIEQKLHQLVSSNSTLR